MYLLKILRMMEKIETEVGNGVKVSFSTAKPREGIMLKAYWEDGFLLRHIVDPEMLTTVLDEELLISDFVGICKKSHPTLMRYVS